MSRVHEARLSRRERERAGRRRDILQAAERVFSEKGYQGATIEEIAQQAEFAVGTIYNFFGGKEDLYKAVIRDAVHEYVRRFEDTVLSKSDPGEAIAALIELRLTHAEEHRGFMRMVLERMPGAKLDLAVVMPEDMRDIEDYFLSHISAIFARYVKGGPLDGADPLHVTLGFEGVLNSFVSYWTRSSVDTPLESRIQTMKQAVFGWFRRGHFKYEGDVAPPAERPEDDRQYE